jgi:hypothetical protein
VRAPPIFRHGTSTPDAPTQPGLVVAKPVSKGERAVWLHGVLAVEDDGRAASDWVRALFVTAVTERGCQPQSSNVMRDRSWFVSPPWVDSRFGLFYLPFHLELYSTLPFPLQNEPTWIHVTAREHCSQPLRLLPGAWGAPRPPDTEVDALVLAYSHVAEGDFVGACDHFARALACEDLRADLDAAHLYAAARAASQAMSVDPSREAASAKSALEWLREEVQRRAARIARIAVELVTCDEARSALLSAEQESHARHLAAIRHDALLAPLRARADYETSS